MSAWISCSTPLQALVPSENVVDEQALYDDAQQLQPGKQGFQFGVLRERIHQILIRAGSEWAKRGTKPFDAGSGGASCEGTTS
jgi:hypothetical protein